MCMFGKPKTPKAPEPKLPRQPVKQSKPADFEAGPQIGFGQTGRAGARKLRIGRRRADPVAGIGGVPTTGALQIGAQVPV